MPKPRGLGIRTSFSGPDCEAAGTLTTVQRIADHERLRWPPGSSVETSTVQAPSPNGLRAS